MAKTQLDRIADGLAKAQAAADFIAGDTRTYSNGLARGPRLKLAPSGSVGQNAPRQDPLETRSDPAEHLLEAAEAWRLEHPGYSLKDALRALRGVDAGRKMFGDYAKWSRNQHAATDTAKAYSGSQSSFATVEAEVERRATNALDSKRARNFSEAIHLVLRDDPRLAQALADSTRQATPLHRF